jgi:hypothetical protein
LLAHLFGGDELTLCAESGDLLIFAALLSVGGKELLLAQQIQVLKAITLFAVALELLLCE